MYKVIDVSNSRLRIKFWSDGYDTDPFGTATHIVTGHNKPDDAEVESERDYFIVDGDEQVAYLYAKGMTIIHEDHHHVHYALLGEFFEDIETGMEVGPGDIRPALLKVWDVKGFSVKYARPEDFKELGLDVEIAESREALEQHQLEGCGVSPETGAPVFTFLVREDAPTPTKWYPPVSHIMNYTAGETEEDAVQRLGVMNMDNEVWGGWSGDAARRLIRLLTQKGSFEIAVRGVSDDEFPDREPSPLFEPEVLDDVVYGGGPDEYSLVDRSQFEDYENEEGKTMKEMLEGANEGV